MKIIPLREFQRNATPYLTEPTTLTTYDKPICVILPIEFYDALMESPEEKPEAVGEVQTGEVNSRGWCETHFAKGTEYDRTLITWEDENGTALVDKKWVCPACLSKYQNMGRGRVYFL